MGQTESITRTHVVLPEELVSEIDALVGKRNRSAFLRESAVRELKRIRLSNALEATAGSWNAKNHPELSRGAAKWVAKMRSEDEAQRQGRRKR